jgi:hypothetical protein
VAEDEGYDMLKARMTALEEVLGLHQAHERELLTTQRDNAIRLLGRLEDALCIEYERSALAKRRDEVILRKAKLV